MNVTSAAPTDVPLPPRRVPLTLRLHVLFGGYFTQFGTR